MLTMFTYLYFLHKLVKVYNEHSILKVRTFPVDAIFHFNLAEEVQRLYQSFLYNYKK